MSDFNLNPINPMHRVEPAQGSNEQKQREQKQKNKDKEEHEEEQDSFETHIEPEEGKEESSNTEPQKNETHKEAKEGIDNPGYTMDWVNLNNIKHLSTQETSKEDEDPPHIDIEG